ncbi:glutamate synthase-related protein [Persicobacter sp. CCB-QB2]|uniref:glutamate synthase-related protein n=1 Tax=Persicobacter sp. CCB-QB2 TaxID=1561025 RepID=UPI0006A975AA|nr:glutamate synthase-related protein [Persicobacter sp. CCB-QB2]
MRLQSYPCDHQLLEIKDLPERQPVGAQHLGLDLVIIKDQEMISVLYGRCLHRGALLADGHLDGHNLICGLHYWDYRIDTGVSEYNNSEALHKFHHKIEEGWLKVSSAEIEAYLKEHPQPFDRDVYLGQYADTNPEAPEPFTRQIQSLARGGLHHQHGEAAAMGVERDNLPKWSSLQFLPAQLHKRPLFDDAVVNTTVSIGPGADLPLKLSMPVFISDMSFGALSKEAKIALARGAEMAGTGICSGEGGMLPEEQENNGHYFYELASAKFGFSWEKVKKCQAFHFKAGQGAKTGTGGHLPGNKVTSEIAEVRGLKEGEDAVSPATFPDLVTVEDFKAFATEVRYKTGGIPVGVKMSAAHLEADIDFALAIGVDYIILDGRGGGTGAAPLILRDNINVPTIPALARARKHLDLRGAKSVSLIVTGGLRLAEDFAKALMLGADAVAISNAALQAIGCLGMRACNTNNCPVGIATQKDHLRARLQIEKSAQQLYNYLTGTQSLLKVISRACGYADINAFNHHDLTTFDREMHHLTGIAYGGINPNQ